jgi:cytochrome b561
MSTDNLTSYTRPAIALHWIMALLLIGVFVLGMYMHELPRSDYKFMLYGYHKSFGIVVLLLAALRMAWRITHRPPALLPGMPAWQEKAAHALHHSLYLLMFLVPITGWLMSSAKGHPVVLFDALPLPDLVGKNEGLGDFFKGFHEVCNYLICTLFFLHVIAAYKHHLIDRDGTLARMLPHLAKK